MSAGGVSVALRCTCESGTALAQAPTAADMPRAIECATCGRSGALHAERLTRSGGLSGCLACGHPELFTRKSWPPALGIAIVIVAAILAPWTHYVSLGVAALIDLALYKLVPDVVVCYVCGAQHRAFAAEPRHPRFDRQIEERLKYGPRAVMGREMRDGGTADAPDPEH